MIRSLRGIEVRRSHDRHFERAAASPQLVSVGNVPPLAVTWRMCRDTQLQAGNYLVAVRDKALRLKESKQYILM